MRVVVLLLLALVAVNQCHAAGVNTAVGRRLRRSVQSLAVSEDPPKDEDLTALAKTSGFTVKDDKLPDMEKHLKQAPPAQTTAPSCSLKYKGVDMLRSATRNHCTSLFKKINDEKTKPEFAPIVAAKVTEDELCALYMYSTKFYRMMNMYLRLGTDQPNPEVTRMVKADNKELVGFMQKDPIPGAMIKQATDCGDAALQKLPKFSGKLYRAMFSPDGIMHVMKKWAESGILSDPGFSSTTTNNKQRIFGKAVNEAPVYITIDCTADCVGASLGLFSAYKGENEVLFPPGTKFCINKVTKTSKQYRFDVKFPGKGVDCPAPTYTNPLK